MNFETVGELGWSSQTFRHPIDLNNSLKFMNTKLDAAGTYLNLAILSLSTYFPKLGFSPVEIQELLCGPFYTTILLCTVRIVIILDLFS